MKKYISLFIFFALSLSAFSQTAGGEWKWARAFGGTDPSSDSPANHIKQVEHDADGNTYILGVYGQFGCWDDGQPIVNNSTIHSSAQVPLFLAKFDSVGNLLWSRLVQSNEQSTGYVGIQLSDSSITVVGKAELDDPEQTTLRPKWLYFFDTLIRSQDVAAIPMAQRHPPFAFGEWTFVSTLDLDGNVQSTVFLENLHRSWLGQRWQRPFFEAISTPEGFFHIDNEGNYVFVLLQKVVGQAEDPYSVLISRQMTTDTSNTFVTDTIDVYFPGSTESPSGIRYLSFYKFSPSWELLSFRPLNQRLDGFAALYEYSLDSINPQVGYTIRGFDLDEDGNYYIVGSLSIALGQNHHGELHNYPCHVYFDSSIYLTVNHIDETFQPPFVLKLSPDGVPLWCNQVHVPVNPLHVCRSIFHGIDVNGDYVYIPITDANYRTIVPDLGEFDIYTPKIGWLKCDKETGVWQHFAVSDTMLSADGENLKSFVYEDHVFITGGNGNIYGYQDFIEHWTTDGTLVETINIGRNNKYRQWASIDNRGDLRVDKCYTTPQDLGDLHLDYGTNHSMAVIALYHNDDFAFPLSREEQSIIWNQDLNFSLADSPVTLTATATSGLPVSYSSSDTSIAHIDGSTLHLLANGSCTILASCPGNATYQAAAPLSKTLTVGQSGITDISSAALIQLYPNPTTGQVQILGLNGEAPHVEILDMTGRPAATFHHTSTLDISNLPPAPYIVKIHLPNGSTHHLKLIKQ